MKTSFAFVGFFALTLWASVASAAVITVDTADNSGAGGHTSLLRALNSLQNGDTIRFNIPGPGPHYIITPQEGYPLIANDNVTIDGYSQPGSSPNTNPILGGNNAHIQIVLDSTGKGIQNLGPLHNPGYGDSESAILGLLGAKNFTIQGISFLSAYAMGTSSDPDIYCLAFINDATNGHVRGCWFGLDPDGFTWAGGQSSIANFKGDNNTTAAGMIIGTDGDGVNDRAEFNVHIGMALAINLETPNVKMSGNYINLFPDGITFLDVEALHQMLVAMNADCKTVESIENGDGHNMIIGTDGDGVSDADERNIFALSDYPHTIEFWGESATNVIIAGNYYGVGVDGMSTQAVPTSYLPIFASINDGGSLRIGSNGDGQSDDLEANLFYNIGGNALVYSGVNTKIISRRNSMFDCGFSGIPFAPFANGGYVNYYSTVLDPPPMMDSDAVPAVLDVFNGLVEGTVPSPNLANYPYSVIDVYLVDPAALAIGLVHPQTYLGTFVEGSTEDLDPVGNSFSFNLNSFTIPIGAQAALEVTYSQDPQATENGRAVSGPLSNPVDASFNIGAIPPRPTLTVSRSGNTVTLAWKADVGLFRLESTDSVKPSNWLPVYGYADFNKGQNSVTLPVEAGNNFFRLVYQ